MSRGCLPLLAILLLLLAGVPHAVAAPHGQVNPSLAIDSYLTSPEQVVAGDEFTLAVEIVNDGNIAVQDLEVRFGVPATGPDLQVIGASNAIYLSGLSPGAVASASKNLSYRSSATAVQQLNLTFRYRYLSGGQLVDQEQILSISLSVSQPTSTPTVTHTPTPTITPTPTLTPSPTPSPTITPTATSLPTAGPPAPESGPVELPTQDGSRSANGSPSGMPEIAGEGRRSTQDVIDARLPVIILANYSVPDTTLRPGRTFRMVMDWRNIGFGVASDVVVTWDGDTIIPVGSGPVWFLPDIRPSRDESLTALFVVKPGTSPGPHELPVGVIYKDDFDEVYSWSAQVNLLVEGTPIPTPTPTRRPQVTPAASPQPTPTPVPTRIPWLLRLLQALFDSSRWE